MESLYNGFKLSMNNFLETHLPGVTIIYDADEPVDPLVTKWISSLYLEYDPISTIKTAEIAFHCFSKQDPEGLENTKLIDKLISIFHDSTTVDDLRRIPLMVVKDDGSMEQKATIVTSDITVDKAYRVGTDINGQAVIATFVWC